MKRFALGMLTGLGLAAAGFAATALAPKAILWPAEKLKWVTFPGAPAMDKPPMMVALWGDITKGSYGAFAKLPAGEKSGLHIHTASVKGTVIAGTFNVGPEGAAAETKLGPGSYFSVPGGLKHTSSCDAGADCVLFQIGTGAFDMKPVEAPAAAPAATPAAATPVTPPAAPPAAPPVKK